MIGGLRQGSSLTISARVSTDGQTLDARLEALKAAWCEKILREKTSGAKADRAGRARLLAAIDGDTMIVSRLDALAHAGVTPGLDLAPEVDRVLLPQRGV